MLVLILLITIIIIIILEASPHAADPSHFAYVYDCDYYDYESRPLLGVWIARLTVLLLGSLARRF